MSIESRNRIVTFRLTAEEHNRFRQLCFEHGIASVSEMARAAINLLLNQPGRAPEGAIAGRMAELEGRLNILTSELKRLNSLVSTAVATSGDR